MRQFMLACAAVGALGLAASATPATAAPLGGLKAPAVESNTIDARCWHIRNRSKHRCTRGHHRRWDSRRHWHKRHHRGYHRQYYSPFPFFLFGL